MQLQLPHSLVTNHNPPPPKWTFVSSYSTHHPFNLPSTAACIKAINQDGHSTPKKDTMKFEEFLMRPSEGQLRRLALENEVEELQERLDGELRVNSVLRWAIKGPVLSFHRLPPELPFKVKVLLTELAVAEEQIMWLERRVRKLKLTLNHRNSRRQTQILDDDDDGRRRIRSSHGKYNTNHSLDLNLVSPRTPRFNAAHLFFAPWRPNAYLCGS